MKDDNFYKDGYEDFYKNNDGDLIWWTNPVDKVGPILFSFDKKQVFDFGANTPTS